MIAKYLRDHLRSVAAIRDRVDGGADFPGIYADNVPQGHVGECIVLRVIVTDHNYHLGGEVADSGSTVQVTVYSDKAARAFSLMELIRNRLSGYRGLMGDSDETRVKTCIIANDVGADIDETAEADDKFIHTYTADYLLIYTTPEPTLA